MSTIDSTNSGFDESMGGFVIPSDIFSRDYYHGLLSKPPLLATTKAQPYISPIGFFDHPVSKTIHAISGKRLVVSMWDHGISDGIMGVLKQMDIEWTSLEVVHIPVATDPSLGPPIVWVGVQPGILSYWKAAITALKCQEVIDANSIADCFVEIRSSAVTRSSGGGGGGGGVRFIDLFKVRDPLREGKDPFTATLSFPISAKETLDTVGPAGFSLDGGGEDNNIYLVTARHVALVESFEEIRIGSNADLQQIVGDMASKIESLDERGLAVENAIANGTATPDDRASLTLTSSKVAKLEDLHKHIDTQWGTVESRVLGELVWAPPISFSIQPASFREIQLDIEIIPIKGYDIFQSAKLAGTELQKHQVALKVIYVKLEEWVGQLQRLEEDLEIVLRASTIRYTTTLDVLALIAGEFIGVNQLNKKYQVAGSSSDKLPRTEGAQLEVKRPKRWKTRLSWLRRSRKKIEHQKTGAVTSDDNFIVPSRNIQLLKEASRSTSELSEYADAPAIGSIGTLLDLSSGINLDNCVAGLDLHIKLVEEKTSRYGEALNIAQCFDRALYDSQKLEKHISQLDLFTSWLYKLTERKFKIRLRGLDPTSRPFNEFEPPFVPSHPLDTKFCGRDDEMNQIRSYLETGSQQDYYPRVMALVTHYDTKYNSHMRTDQRKFEDVEKELGIPGQIDGSGQLTNEASKNPWHFVRNWMLKEGNHRWCLQAAEEVANKLGYLPVALSQAAAYVATTAFSLVKYLARLNENLSRYLGMKSEGYPEGVFSCWVLSVHIIMESNPHAIELLQLCSFLSPHGVSEELLYRVVGGIDWAQNDTSRLDEALDELVTYSLITRKSDSSSTSEEKESFWIHPLVQHREKNSYCKENIVVLEDNKERLAELRSVGARAAVRLVGWGVVGQAIDRQPKERVYELANMAHLDLCINQYLLKDIDIEYIGRENDEIRQRLKGELRKAEEYLDKSVEIWQETSMEWHSAAIGTLGNLGELKIGLQDYAGACECFRRAVAGSEANYGLSNTLTLRLLGNLRKTYIELGQFGEAEQIAEKIAQGENTLDAFE
ncbi:hypothetical protein TWF703_002392 [Orbilia oligospora]|uniref:DUF7779 domain-containing protein n=1 Tax=Orbilia oligospora TaxID=2813651 RepID=A0A7C8NQC8_ORBOL|nr:hypothetical protein TWF703_002392 [Orbilia oligospora]